MATKRKKKNAPGAGRPNTLGATKLVAVRLPLATIANLEQMAAAQGTSVSAIIRDLIQAQQ